MKEAGFFRCHPPDDWDALLTPPATPSAGTLPKYDIKIIVAHS
jgi:hypothetical protein